MDRAPGETGVRAFDELSDLGGPARQLRLQDIDRSVQSDDAINIQFASGVTGQPKGATLSHCDIVKNARFATDRIKVTENDRLAISVPPHHLFGMVMVMVMVMVMGVWRGGGEGVAMAFRGEAFDPAQTLGASAAQRWGGRIPI